MGKLFDELKAMKDAYDLKLKTEGSTALGEVFKEFFQEFPEVYAVTWTEYTPYFMDGDVCEFSVNELKVVWNEDDDYDCGDSSWELMKGKKRTAREKEIGKALEVLSNELPDDVLESVFGDHCRVVATREGFNVTEFEHE